MIEEVEKLQGIPGAQKKELVVSTVRDIYRKVNPDIPWIPEPFETMIVDVVLDKVLNAFVDFLVAKYKEKGFFK